MFLSDNEKRDLIKYIESGKELPEKYRFLLFEDKKEVELVWNGKTNGVTNVVLPFQTIEQVDEPRSEKDLNLQGSLFDFDNRGRQIKDWTNKLIWGDNKLILSSLKNGPMRKEIEDQGGIKLIYIDPPFDVGADFSMDIEIGDEQFTKKPNVLEELAYRDTWGKGADSFIAMIYERLSLMRDLLADDGSIYVHCDWRVNSYMRLILDEIFGKKLYKNEITWEYQGSWVEPKTYYPRRSQKILFYTKNEDYIFNRIYEKEKTEKGVITRWQRYLVDGKIFGDNAPYEDGKFQPYLNKFIKQNGRKPKPEDVIVEFQGRSVGDVWYVSVINPVSPENLNYPTQKPEELIKRIIEGSSNKNDIVADFFCGSGTTLSVAEKLERKWLGSDLGKFAIHTTRKRIIEVQRELKKENKDYRAFEILNLGKYERQHYIGINPNLREEEQEKQIAQKEKDFISMILSAYRAEEIEGFKTFYGKKGARLVSIGPINLPVSRLFVEEVINECKEKKITKVDILAFEFEMGLFPNIQEEAKSKGIDLGLKYIPRDVFDKRAIEKNQVVFHDVSYIEVKPIVKKSSVAIKLTDFSVFYNQDSTKEVEENLKGGGKKLIVENGQIIKIAKDKNGIVSKEILTKKWTDWIDYWAVDFNFESKKEVIKVQNKKGELEDSWTGDYIFENEWQDFRTKKKRELELETPFVEVKKGKRKIAIKVVDIFGNDTMKIIEINV